VTSFGDLVRRRHAAGVLVVQPRMGVADPAAMRRGLLATRDACAGTVGTITLDSYTRVGDFASVDRALRDGADLNGYPVVNHGPEVTRGMLDDVVSDGFPVQVRHGSARPSAIVEALCRAGLHATEGGPVSYCLPYGRTSLVDSLRDWTRACDVLVRSRAAGVEPHVETFGGCMMGQLCPPSLLVAISVLEALYFRSHGLRSISVSYAQQTSPEQDREAVGALRRLSGELLADVDWHVVIYAYMGLYPRSAAGAQQLLAAAAQLAVETGSERLIVKTVAEAFRVPTVEENVAALRLAAAVAARHRPAEASDGGQTYAEARALVEAVLDVDPDVGRALVAAVRRGLLDVPYCLHPDNAGRSRALIGADGWLRWADVGAMPLRRPVGPVPDRAVSATDLLSSLSYVRSRYDVGALTAGHRMALDSGPVLNS
jgi:methylaspartate mutase epsilon subunit